jgi:hypothetical protein
MAASEKDICVHLRPILERLLERARVVAVSDGWSAVRLAVTISRGPTPRSLRAASWPPPIEPWENTDSHYAIECGLICRACAHSLGWPQDGAYED